MPEWAQLLAGAPVPEGLARGRWYPVQGRTDDQWVRVIGTSGHPIPVGVALVRIIDRAPAAITRLAVAAIGRDDPGRFGTFRYCGVCPRGHDISKVRPADAGGVCAVCGVTYPIEDEVYI